MVHIIGLAAQAPTRGGRLSSNVRPRSALAVRAIAVVPPGALPNLGPRAPRRSAATANSDELCLRSRPLGWRVARTCACTRQPPLSACQWCLRPRKTVPSASAVQAQVVRESGINSAAQALATTPSKRWRQRQRCARHQGRGLTGRSRGTSAGKALGPRSARCHHAPRGPSAFPATAPQLKR